MADDNILRSYRSSDPNRRSAAPSGEQATGSDPLAELARLIGQTDPFAEFGRGNARASEPREPQYTTPAAPPTVPDWRKVAAAMPPYETVHEQSTLSPDPHFAPANSTFPRHDPYQMASLTEPPPEPRVEAGQTHGRYQHDQQFADAEQLPAGHDNRMYVGAARGAHEDVPYYDDGTPMAPQDEEMYDDAPRSRRVSGLVTAVTLIGCAMIGTAGAYGYRTYYAGSGSNKTPPVITADAAPSKVVSAPDAQSSKVIQDRVGPLGQNERIVPREEKPVEMQVPGTSSAPRVVLPAPVAPQAQGAPPAPPAASPGALETKRVRTVTIRPDGTDLSGKPVGGIAPSAGQPPATARPAPAAKSTQPAARGGPLSLDPQTQASASPPPQTRERVASAPPPTPPAPRLAAVSTNGGSGGYVVQLSSQRSESEAQSSFRSLQAKFPNELGGRQPIVRRADLGDKGVYYRAMVGPFGSADEAGRFCSGLKAAGGQCIIQKN